MKYLKIFIFMVFWSSFVYGQGVPDMSDKFSSTHYTDLSDMFYSAPYKTLQEGVLESSKRHAIYSYIVANLSTPGFDFYAYLPPDDQRVLAETLPDTALSNQVMTEFLMTRIAINSRRYSALMTMWGGKKNMLTKVVTLGK